jgi:hypothetical protein
MPDTQQRFQMLAEQLAVLEHHLSTSTREMRPAPGCGRYRRVSPIPSGGATPVNVFTAAQTGSSFGEGTVVDIKDKLLIV